VIERVKVLDESELDFRRREGWLGRGIDVSTARSHSFARK